MKKTVALVLGSGAARGNAHIGVINAVLEQGYEIVSLAGCSIGSIVAGAYATGTLNQFQEWSESLDRVDVLRMLDMSLFHGAYIRGDRYFHAIEEITGNPNIEDLTIPYTSVAVDLLSQKECWFQRGSLISAMRASSAVPSIVTPVQINGRVYVDGGVLNPLPIIPTVAANADYIIAVDLNGPAMHGEESHLPQPIDDNEPEWWSSVKGLFGLNRDDESEEVLPKRYDPESWGRIQTINMMFETMQESLTQYKLAGYPPDLLISIPKDASGFYEFWRAKELIDLGYEAATKALTDLTAGKRPLHSFPKGY
ncbi:alpha/beta hydrolase [Maribrevibacterium harenarium]|uniref:Alpha/beta hydrolase n=1 Tax=Maribrevibacterium harenarium TaxID=2589817 RepID=A0A501X549_9GAMM|nr:patatin-like phospholipase family protein [Maribrevibacterium harenarium]TPE55670.1 alpha/beta hydrolase [Maribrevibacterium harenarium]